MALQALAVTRIIHKIRKTRVSPDIKVSTADFIKNYGALADRALSEPLTIIRNGRDRLVVLSAEEYARLKRRDRRVVKLEEFTAEEIAAIEAAEVVPEDVVISARPSSRTAGRA